MCDRVHARERERERDGCVIVCKSLHARERDRGLLQRLVLNFIFRLFFFSRLVLASKAALGIKKVARLVVASPITTREDDWKHQYYS
jgi:hypothetical protein